MWIEADNDYLINMDQVRSVNLEEMNSSSFKIWAEFVGEGILCLGAYDNYDDAQDQLQFYLEQLREE